MRESRTYGSVRGARDEIRVPTATVVDNLVTHLVALHESAIGETGKHLVVVRFSRFAATVRDETLSMAGASHLARPWRSKE
jgi:hypothetical protein